MTVKLYDRGLEAIEVSDNGHGVTPNSRPYMAMKHATSKLRHFDDLYTNWRSSGGNRDSGNRANNNTSDYDCAPTLGFRGEALFCLANISRSLTVSTRSAEDNDTSNNDNATKSKLGEQFDFDSNGHIIPTSIKRIPLSQLTGTTVTVRGLFESLPVRRVDMCKRIKVQRMKLMKMMQGYAILCLGTQFNLTDISGPSNNSSSSKTSKQKIEVRLATSESSKTLESRVASVLGTKFLSGLTRIDVDLSKAVQLSSTSTTTNSTNNNGGTRWKVQGLISHSPASPHSSNARELQFFGINGRPVDLPSVSRLLGDVWRMFDPTSSAAEGGGESNTTTGRRRPACVLAFSLPNNMYDVNLSPDKREVMFTEEAAMSELLREGLMELWSSQSEGKFEANEVESRSKKNGKGGGNYHERESTKRHEAQHDKSVELTQRNDSNRHNEIETDGITPKLRRRNMEDGIIVTPVDSEDPIQNDLTDTSSQPLGDVRDTAFDDQTCDRGNLPSSSTQNVTKPQENSNDSSNREAHVDWNQMQLPQRARTQDRRNWNQMQINFERIQKAESRLEVDRILSPDDDIDDRTSNDNNLPTNNIASKKARSTSESTTISKSTDTNSSLDDDRSTMHRLGTHRQPARMKRQTKKDVTSFLDSFAYGSTKRAKVAEDDYCEDDCDDDCDSDESVRPEVRNLVDSRRSDPKNGIVRSSRMVLGRTVVANIPPQPTRRNVRAKDMKGAESHHRDDVESGIFSNSHKSPPVDVVWNSFTGTQNVVAHSHHARLMMRNTRKDMKRKREDRRDHDAIGTTDGAVVASGKGETVDLCKEDFLHMSIIGQFNLGFILARCRNNNLWILDQHACDEKYNFERLCKETVIHEQTLIAPLPLDLSPSEEHCVLEHMDDFERNGFRFSYDPEKEPRHRLSLTALPHSGSGGDGKKAVQFGKEDVGALCAMLGADGTSSSDGYHAGFGTGAQGSRIAGVNAVRRYAGLTGTGSYQGAVKSNGIVGSTIVRLPKAIAMFASRACRVSDCLLDSLCS